jgi:hypothetical protein
LVMTTIAGFKFLIGAPGGEGIVMAPEVFVFAFVLSLPGIAVFLLGQLLKRRRRSA